MTSGNSKLKSRALKLFCNVPKRVTKRIREVVHEHPMSVTLQFSHLAMRYGSGGTDGIALFPRNIGLSQANNQVLNQLGTIPNTVLVGKRNMVEFFVLFYPS